MTRFIRSYWHERPFFMVMLTLVSLAFGFCSAIYWEHLMSGPPIVIDRAGSEQYVSLEGRRLAIMVDQSRLRIPCDGAHADRRLMHFPAGVDVETADPDAIVPLREDRVAYQHLGKRKFILFLGLQFDLPRLSGGAWYYEAVIFNGCGAFSRLLPDRPITTPRSPVNIVTDHPQ